MLQTKKEEVGMGGYEQESTGGQQEFRVVVASLWLHVEFSH